MGLDNSNFIKACYKRNDGRIPLWVMRQAGRYLPEYRKVREDVSFLDLCRTPSLIAEVVHQPLRRFDLDAAILFSDILTMLAPMGAKFEFPGGGPKLDKPIATPEDVDRLHDIDIDKSLSFVFDGIREIKKVLPDLPLIGFVGSPFTLSCYLIEGQGSKAFDKTKKFLHQYPAAGERLFDLLSHVAERYLAAQIDAGCDAVQIFDSWGGILSTDDYRRWSATYTDRIFKGLQSKGVPRILFVNNLAPYVDLVREVECEVVGVDYRMKLADAAAALPDKALQGNLDPSVLFGTPEEVASSTRQILQSVDDHDRLIFNLGHGIQPTTPIESVQALVEAVHSYRN